MMPSRRRNPKKSRMFIQMLLLVFVLESFVSSAPPNENADRGDGDRGGRPRSSRTTSSRGTSSSLSSSGEDSPISPSTSNGARPPSPDPQPRRTQRTYPAGVYLNQRGEPIRTLESDIRAALWRDLAMAPRESSPPIARRSTSIPFYQPDRRASEGSTERTKEDPWYKPKQRGLILIDLTSSPSALLHRRRNTPREERLNRAADGQCKEPVASTSNAAKEYDKQHGEPMPSTSGTARGGNYGQPIPSTSGTVFVYGESLANARGITTATIEHYEEPIPSTSGTARGTTASRRTTHASDASSHRGADRSRSGSRVSESASTVTRRDVYGRPSVSETYDPYRDYHRSRRLRASYRDSELDLVQQYYADPTSDSELDLVQQYYADPTSDAARMERKKNSYKLDSPRDPEKNRRLRASYMFDVDRVKKAQKEIEWEMASTNRVTGGSQSYYSRHTQRPVVSPRSRDEQFLYAFHYNDEIGNNRRRRETRSWLDFQDEEAVSFGYINEALTREWNRIVRFFSNLYRDRISAGAEDTETDRPGRVSRRIRRREASAEFEMVNLTTEPSTSTQVATSTTSKIDSWLDVQRLTNVQFPDDLRPEQADLTDETSLRAVRNYDARLPCGQGKIFLDGPDAYVLWVKDDEKFLYRFPNEDTLTKSLNPNNIYGTSCVDTDHCYDDTSLFLPKVGDKDAGKYRCRVHYQGSSSVDYVIDLRIVEATGTPKLYDEKNEQIATPYIGPLTLGSNFTIICEVVISDPPTTVLWLRNGVTVRRIVSDKPGILREKVEIVNATRDELDAHYQCSASNADVTEAMAASVVVKMYLPPLKVEIRLNNNVNFEVGQPRVVDCVVVGCVPTPTINWYIGGTLLKASAHKELHDGNYTVSSLTLTASMRDDKKWLSCRVHNAYLPTIYEDNVTLHVGYRPSCNVSDAKVIGITPGEPKEIACTIVSPERPRHFKWVFADRRTLFTNAMVMQGHTHTYTTTLTWVPSDTDIGLLECYSENMFGEQREPCLYTLVMGGAPQAPECYQLDLPTGGFRIACEPGWDGGSDQTIHLEVRNPLGVTVYNDSSTNGKFHVPLEVTLDNVTSIVYAQNSRGKSIEQKIPMNSATANHRHPQVESFLERVLVSSTIVGFAVVSLGAGCYYLVMRRRTNRQTRRDAAIELEASRNNFVQGFNLSLLRGDQSNSDRRDANAASAPDRPTPVWPASILSCWAKGEVRLSMCTRYCGLECLSPPPDRSPPNNDSDQ